MNGVFWILGPPRGARAGEQPALAVVLCPDGGRSLRGELLHLKQAGINTLVSMLSRDQVRMLDLEQEPAIAQSLGMHFVHHPIRDHELPPDVTAFGAFAQDLAQRVLRGESVGVHCWGSIGRATVTAACTLIHMGWEPRTALAAVEAARGCPVPDTEEQERWILNYRPGADRADV